MRLTKKQKLAGSVFLIALSSIAVGGHIVQLAGLGIRTFEVQRAESRGDILAVFIDKIKSASAPLRTNEEATFTFADLPLQEMIVVMGAPYVGIVPTQIGISQNALRKMANDQLSDGLGQRTILYLIRSGEIQEEEALSRCDLTVRPGDALVIRPVATKVVAKCVVPECPLSPKAGQCALALSVEDPR